MKKTMNGIFKKFLNLKIESVTMFHYKQYSLYFNNLNFEKK